MPLLTMIAVPLFAVASADAAAGPASAGVRVTTAGTGGRRRPH